MITEAEYQTYLDSLSPDVAAMIANVYRAIADNPVLSRPTDLATAARYQEVADRKRGEASEAS